MCTKVESIKANFGWHKCVVATVDGNLDSPIAIAFNSVGRDGMTYHFEDELSGTIEEGGCEYPHGILPPKLLKEIATCLDYYNTGIVDATEGLTVGAIINDIMNHCLSLYGNFVADESVFGCSASLVFIDSTMTTDEAINYVKSKVETNSGEQVPCLSTIAFLRERLTGDIK